MAVFLGQKEIETAIRDYFGEIMGPVAMMGGAVLGQAEDAPTNWQVVLIGKTVKLFISGHE